MSKATPCGSGGFLRRAVDVLLLMKRGDLLFKLSDHRGESYVDEDLVDRPFIVSCLTDC